MTETTDTAAAPAKSGGLSTMLLPELKKVAGGLGIKATGMKKAELVAAIKAAQGGGQGGGRAEKPRKEAAEKQARDEAPQDAPKAETRNDAQNEIGRASCRERV